MDRERIAELFAGFGRVDVRRVFSGFGVYADDVCFALFLREDIYLNADETSIPRFVAEGSAPFTYSTSRKTVSVQSYWKLPSQLYDDPDELADWARQALASATRRKLAKSAKTKASKPSAPRRAAGAPKAAPKAASAPSRKKAAVTRSVSRKRPAKRPKRR